MFNLNRNPALITQALSFLTPWKTTRIMNQGSEESRYNNGYKWEVWQPEGISKLRNTAEQKNEGAISPLTRLTEISVTNRPWMRLLISIERITGPSWIEPRYLRPNIFSRWFNARSRVSCWNPAIDFLRTTRNFVSNVAVSAKHSSFPAYLLLFHFLIYNKVCTVNKAPSGGKICEMFVANFTKSEAAWLLDNS